MSGSRAQNLKLAIVVIATIVLAALVWSHMTGMNGPYYWKWHWRRLAVFPLLAPMILAVIPFAIGQWLFARGGSVLLSLALVTASTFLLQWAAISGQPPGGLSRAPYLIQNPQATSYFADAHVPFVNHLRASDWLRDFPGILPNLHLHSRYKPPGPLLFHLFFLEVFQGDASAAFADAIAISLLAAAAVPMCFALVRALTNQIPSSFCAASYFALCPSLLLMFPQLDQVYALLSSIILISWILALLRKSVPWSVLFGVSLAVGSFTSYIFLGLGVFLAIFTLLSIKDHPWPAFKTAILCAAVGIATFVLFYALLYFAYRFNPIATFREISELQMEGILWIGRPFPLHLPFDLLDFLLGTAWISGIMLLFYVCKPAGNRAARRAVWLALLQIGVLWLAALLPGETARLWLPFMPLLMIPIGLELARWTARGRAIVFACVFVLSFSICRNMIFVYAGPAVDGLRPYYLPFQSAQERARMEQINPDPAEESR